MQDSYAIQIIKALREIVAELAALRQEIHSLKVRVGQLK